MASDPGSDGESPGVQPEGQDGTGQAAGQEAEGGQEQPKDRTGQVADAVTDPLTEAAGGTASRSAEQAYRSWARHTHAAGPATFIGGGSFGEVHIGGTTIYGYDRHARAPGRVRPEVTERLVARYVPVACYASLRQRLEATRLLALRGAPGTGRAATGLRLLADVAGEHVSRYGPDTDISQLSSADLTAGCGYLLELIPGWAKAASVAATIDRLHQHLTERECFLVVILPHDVQYQAAFEEYVQDCPLPDPRQVLLRAIECEMQDQPATADKLQELTANPSISAFDACRLPSEAQWAATLMVSHALGNISAEEMTKRAGESLSHYVAGWFEPLAHLPSSSAADDQVKLATFRIALAVFHQTPFDVVAEAGELLAGRILRAWSPKRQPGRAVFANHRNDYLADSRGRLVPGTILFGKSGAPSLFAEYADDRMPTAILRHVWEVHNIRSQILPWLQELSRDNRPFVWMRAALAIGQLCSWDFAYTFHEFIDPWASSRGEESKEESRRRLIAAVALDAASRNPEVRPVIREIIDGWCRSGSREQRWTAATALGYDLGLDDIQASLRNLQAVGSWQDGELALIASWAVARVFSRGGIEPVLATLERWLGDDRRDVRQLGLRAALRIANAKVADLDDPGALAQASSRQWQRLDEREDWPLLAALADENPDLLDPFADIVWPVTRSAAFQALGLDVLTSWVRACQKDHAAIAAVGRLLTLLGDDETDQARLTHLIDALSRDREDPLPSDIAERLTYAIRTAHDLSREEAPA